MISSYLLGFPVGWPSRTWSTTSNWSATPSWHLGESLSPIVSPLKLSPCQANIWAIRPTTIIRPSLPASWPIVVSSRLTWPGRVARTELTMFVSPALYPTPRSLSVMTKEKLILVHSFPTNSILLSGLTDYLSDYLEVYWID